MVAEQDKREDSVAQGSALPEARRLDYLKAMGIQPWFEKYPVMIDAKEQAGGTTMPAAEPVIEKVAEETGRPQLSAMDCEQLRALVSDCQLCGLHTSRTRTVFGEGHRDAELFIISDAPTGEEESKGQPGVGEPGLLLDAMLAAIGLKRQQVYMANVIKCRPPDDRTPQTSEIICCDAYLQRQIELIRPKVILVLGQLAAQHLLVTQDPLLTLRATTHQYNGIPLLVSHPPAHLITHSRDKKDSWQDLLRVKQLLVN
ncbi:MAG: uracil-DNA glycosylase [Gammaproteobacteria bacterium]|nr:uracil-DNA glycosylase [Gammaproteobacteria bacterium]